jgi:pimeloyl-ACP methyl ester carboxylesterase
VPWLRGKYAKRRAAVPVRWVTGGDDPVITPALHRGYEEVMPDCEFEKVPEIGHWIVEQAPELVVDRLRAFMKL